MLLHGVYDFWMARSTIFPRKWKEADTESKIGSLERDMERHELNQLSREQSANFLFLAKEWPRENRGKSFP
jgi:hypothetical protein